jgi:molybdate transport system substrate-binding protein
LTTLHFLSAGAAQGLVKALRGAFEADNACVLQGRFGAVGAMKEALLAGEPCDVMIVTDSMIDALAADGTLRLDTKTPLGRVRTGIAVPAGQPRADVASPEALKAALLTADEIYFPDPLRATAGIHFAAVLQQLGIHEAVASRCRTFPNGATAMREMAAGGALRRIGCTQITEILYTEGVALCGPLPARFELATVYSAAVATGSAQPTLARRLIERLGGPGAQSLRAQGGFEA